MQANKSRIDTIISSVLIGLAAAFGLMDLIYTFTGAYAQYGLLYPAAHGFLNILLFLAISFIWAKEKWATYLLLGIAILHLGVDILVERPIIIQWVLLVPAVYFLFRLRK
jgi:hypothetical protein